MIHSDLRIYGSMIRDDLLACRDHRDVVRYPDSKDRFFNRVITDISVMLRETTLTTSDSIETVRQSNPKLL